MKKFLIGSSVGLLLTPLVAFAAYNDVSLTTDTVLTVNGQTLNISTASATIESIEVSAGSFSATLAAGSSLEVTAPNLNRLSAGSNTGITKDICDNTRSILKFETNSTITVTVTPNAELCSGNTSSGGSDAGNSTVTTTSSGGGGGGSAIATNTTTAVVTTPTTPTTPAVTQTTQTTQTTQAIAGSPEVLALVNQLRSLITLLKSLGGTVSAELEATINALAPASSGASFTRNLEVGMTGEDVTALQIFLNTHGYVVTESGAGSPGNETSRFGALTRSALAKFQAANGISPAVGYFGPKTRALINSM